MTGWPPSFAIALGAALPLCACNAANAPQEEIDFARYGVECAVHGAQTFAKVCYFQPAANAESRVRVIRHPDGGFRVFEHAESLSGLTARDGADESIETVVGDKVVVSIGGDRYRFDVPVAGE